MAIEPYDITEDLSDQDIYLSVLRDDTIDAGLSTLTTVDANAKDNANKVRFHFPSPLSGPDKTTLDGVVAAYDPAGTQPVASPEAELLIEDVEASANEKVWGVTTTASTLKVGTCTDAGVASNSGIEITRTGETVDAIALKAPVSVTGAITVTGTVDGRDVDADGTALDALGTSTEKVANKNAASGYPGLDGSSKLTGTQQVYGTAANTACEGNDSRINVFGTELNRVDKDTVSTASSATFSEKLRLPATGDITLPAGTYVLDVSYSWASSHVDGQFQCRIAQNDSRIGKNHEQHPAIADDVHLAKRSYDIVLTADDYNWTFEIKNVGGYTSSTWDVYMRLYRTN